ncbi:MAG: hypothetical protein QGG36_04315, partial [Pirellulaceae bacterium]|nr:hypothetical protein [Pirellulaceae bacterium]
DYASLSFWDPLVPSGAFLEGILFNAPGTAKPNEFSPAELVVYGRELELRVELDFSRRKVRNHLMEHVTSTGTPGEIWRLSLRRQFSSPYSAQNSKNLAAPVQGSRCSICGPKSLPF